jgi:nucleoside recognition membrane protein YjiH
MMSVMRNPSNKTNFLYFILPSFLGIFFFLTPIEYGGESKIIVAHLAKTLHDYAAAWWPHIITSLLTLAAFLTCWASFWKPHWTKSYPWLGSICMVTPVWLLVRFVGALLAILALCNLGVDTLPDDLYDREKGVLFVILPVLLANLLFGLLLSPLLMQFGLLDFIGILMNGIMRPIFQLPGRAAVNCLASWVGDGTIGTILSIREYEKGGYTAKEASTVITCFSAVSITFCVFLLGEMDLAGYFGAFYFTTLLSGFVAAIVMPRIPPLSNKKDLYIDGEPRKDDEKSFSGEKKGLWSKGLSAALDKAQDNKSLLMYAKKVLISWVELIIGTLPSVMAIATLGLLAANSPYIQPVLHFLGKPFVPFLTWAGIPEAARAADTFFVGFIDMFIPLTMIKDLQGDTYAITRFIVAAMSVTQLIYLSEQGALLLGGRLQFSLKDLLLIFLLRTLITLPVIVVCAKFFFS